MPHNERFYYSPTYHLSYALVIGIDKYQSAPPLNYAVSDANSIQEIMAQKFGFLPENITLLTNQDATRSSILRAISKLSRVSGLDDRVLIFFAGHGHTLEGNRGEVGFLVPYDGEVDDFSSLIAWKELVATTQFLRAKHVLFLMDACYSGLALTRAIHAGSSRFLKDMMMRRARQVLTAGKADEVVADSGGPVPHHSVFTGHLIQAFEGDAADSNGVITGSGVLAYVYSKVANDPNSEQTPHYGHVDGDGDFIFLAPNLSNLEEDTFDQDVLLSVPYAEEDVPRDALASMVDKVKKLLARNDGSIELHDLLMGGARQFLASTSEAAFSLSPAFSLDELLGRLEKYEEASGCMALSLACVAYWGGHQHISSLQKCFARATDRLGQVAGLSTWIALRWYPIIRSTYCAGIAAVHAGRFDNLNALLSTVLGDIEYHDARTLGDAVCEAISETYQHDLFKRLPGHEKNYVPLSEYLFKNIQPSLDDAFFMGKGYEPSFDFFEVILSLYIIDLRLSQKKYVWGSPGRFNWKARSHGLGPAERLLSEARLQRDSWPPLRAGFFGGSFDRFEAAAQELEKNLGRV